MSGLTKIGILAGKGALPVELVAACEASGRPYTIVAFEGETPGSLTEGREHFWTRVGAVGGIIDNLKARGASAMVMAGRIERPKVTSLRPDVKGAKLLARLGGALFAGDDRVLKTITAFFEEEGFELLGADDLLDRARVSEGVLGAHAPSAEDLADLWHGYEIARLIGSRDIGQAVIVQAGTVLGLEAIEGTDQLIARCAALRTEGRGGVLVKAMKPQQERRADLPAIGPETIARMREGRFAGVGLEAGQTLILEREATLAAADAAGLFVYGIGKR